MTQAPASPVVVADDDPSMLKLLVRVLSAHLGRPVTGADSVAAATRAVTGGPVSLVVCDLHFSDGSGRDVLSALRCSAPNRNVPFVLCTADDAPVSAAWERRPTAVVTKPFDLQGLRAVCAGLVGRRRDEAA